MKAFIERHALPAYFVLAFVISWGGMLLLIGGPSGLRPTSAQSERLLPMVWLAYAAGPGLSSLLLTGLISRRSGLRELLSRLQHWRVRVRWYAVALLPAPLIAGGIFFALSLFSSEFIPVIVTTQARASLLMVALSAGLAGGLAEELGWTGFAMPRWRMRFSVLASGLMIGAVWGAWHFLANFWWSGTHSGSLARSSFLAAYVLTGVAQLMAYRLLMAWVYDRSQSLLVATIMHASLIVSTVALVPPTTGVAFLTWFVAFTAVLWILVTVIVVANRAQLSAPPETTGKREPAGGRESHNVP